MNKKLTLVLIIMLTLICLISGGVFAAPQSSPNVSHTRGKLQDWTYTGTKLISGMRGTSGAMGNTGSLDVHLQRNTEYGAMLILGLSDYGKQASGVGYTNLFAESAKGLPTTTGNVSGIYNIFNNSNYAEHVAAGIPNSRYSYYLYYGTTSTNRDEYSTSTTALKKGDAMNLFGTTISATSWLRGGDNAYYYGMTRSGFSYNIYQTYEYRSGYSNPVTNMDTNAYARAVVTQYN